MTFSSSADWLSAVAEATASPPPPRAPLAAELDGYQRLLIAWDEALNAGSDDPAGQALAVLARHVDQQRLRQLRGLLCPGGLYEALVLMPMPGLDMLPDPDALGSWPAPGLAMWQAVVAYRRRLDHLLALYDGLGTRSLERLQAALAEGVAPPVRSPRALYGLWQRCVDACEAEVLRVPDYSARLAAVARAATRLRAEQRRWAAQWLGIHSASEAQRALSDEIADIRRQLRLMARPGR
ncbi:MAG TPA: hypothetical protein DCZ11_03430 [Gammaproteobacteria bacterium]|nr:hypothetical protein [Gammaproteobacteria bacterium]HCZ48041.1 hypothetical protein [Gammaproteobacteria bacterium]MCH77479.1 hypothetical protein [Gammaproteobacteria bacterium]